MINTRVIGDNANSCYVSYTPENNQLHLTNDEGTLWLKPALTPGVAATVSNSQCTVNGASSSVSMVGNNLTLNVSVTFTKALVGYQSVFLYAGGLSGQNSTWIKKGTWAPNAIFVPTGSMHSSRALQTATLLNNGMVLMAGGAGESGSIASAELYNPATGTFTPTGSMNTPRRLHTATLLGNGMVLVAGGYGPNGVVNSAELYNPATGSFTPTGNLTAPRGAHTATLLYSGLVLIAGGVDPAGVVASAELYNPATGTFTATGSLNYARESYTATLLNDETVLMAGGFGVSGVVGIAERYNPTTGAFTTTGSLNTARGEHTATLLNNWLVLIAGGASGLGGIPLQSAELYDLTTGTFTPTGDMNAARYGQVATLLNNWTVLIAGGATNSGNQNALSLASAELYNPATGSFSSAGNMNTARVFQTATLLTDGKVLIAGGTDFSGSSCCGPTLTSAELYEPATLTPPGLVSIFVTPATFRLSPETTEQFTATGFLNGSYWEQLSSVTWSSSDPTVAQIGNDVGNRGVALAVAPGTVTITATDGIVSGSATLTVALNVPASIAPTSGTPQTAVIATSFASPLVVTVKNGLGNGVSGVTVTFIAPQFGASGTFAGGTFGGGDYTAITNASGVATSSVFTANGTAGGPYVVTAQVAGVTAQAAFVLTNQAGPWGTIQLTGNLNSARTFQTATALNDGTVLLTGGVEENGTLITAEVYNPAAGDFSLTGSMNVARFNHTATLLSNGMALIVGGGGYDDIAIGSAELYDPATKAFTLTGSLKVPRWGHTATLLSDGKVLIAGGAGNGGSLLSSAELYDPATGSFTLTGRLNTVLSEHTATLLNNGMVLICGGTNATNLVTSAELYNPATASFSATGNMNIGRVGHTVTLLNSGMVLVAGGGELFVASIQASAELYNPATGTFSITGSMTSARENHAATLLNNGMVLMSGGYWSAASVSAFASTEVYNPATGSFAFAGNLSNARAFHTSTLLNDGMVLIAGGSTSSDPAFTALASAELFAPTTFSPPNLVSIAITPATPTLDAGDTLQFVATGTFSDNSTQQLASVTWSTSNGMVAQISNDAGNHGTAVAVAAGTVTITATAGSVIGSSTLTVK